MIAKMKCSNCGADISTLNMTWGQKYWWFTLPIMLLGFWPLAKMTLFKGDITKDLVISEISRRVDGSSLEIIGLITNQGGKSWSGVTVEAEFFDASGTFIDEESEYLRTDIAPHAKEHFKITLRSKASKVSDPATKMNVKIAGGHSMPF